MALPYSLRLACLVITSAGILQVAIELLLWAGAPTVLRLMRGFSVRSQERILFLLQTSPFPVALLAAVLCCVPQYLRNETNHGSEEIGWACLLLTLAVTSWFAATLLRCLLAVFRTMTFARACRRAGDLHGETMHNNTPVLTLTGDAHPVALIGLVRPFILVPRNLIEGRTLSPDALELVLHHERSHATHFDNWKLLSLYLLPRLNLKLRQGDTWMQLWQRTTEWAADEEAVGNDSERALLLAQTLITVVRSCRLSPKTLIHAAFSCEEKDLISRIDRLIAPAPVRQLSQRRLILLTLSMGALGLSAVVVNVLHWTAALHSVSESLLHLG
jgi:beta-lactamase regulating signal transducer with metallopeptidase domain